MFYLEILIIIPPSETIGIKRRPERAFSKNVFVSVEDVVKLLGKVQSLQVSRRRCPGLSKEMK